MRFNLTPEQRQSFGLPLVHTHIVAHVPAEYATVAVREPIEKMQPSERLWAGAVLLCCLSCRAPQLRLRQAHTCIATPANACLLC